MGEEDSNNSTIQYQKYRIRNLSNVTH